MELRQIIYFMEVKKTGKVSIAADNLYVTQPTITTSIKKLEQEFNIKLFERNHNGLELTEAGKTFDKHAIRILNEINKTYTDMEMLEAGNNVPLQINIPAVSCGMFYPLIYNDFAITYPNINIQINDTFSYESIRRVVDEETELGICIYNKEFSEDLNFIEFAQGEIMLLVQDGGTLSKCATLSLNSLSDQLWIFNRRINSRQTATEITVLESFKRLGLDIPRIQYIEDHHTITTTVAMGGGIYPYPNTSEKNPFDGYPGITSKKIEENIDYKIGLVYKRGKQLSASAKQFIMWYKELKKKLNK